MQFHYEGIFLEVLERLGKMPLPPYIKEELQDGERYQTVYSKINGSAAAPTAGLHFTQELLDKLAAKGVREAYITLHVRPRHVPSRQGCGNLGAPHALRILHDLQGNCGYHQRNQSAAGGRIVCVGTTSCRTLESLADENGYFHEASAWTDIFIYPGYKFKAMDALITNFHLPESTLVMLVSAFADREKILNAYNIAVQERYRFFSFGDAMFIS